MLACSGPGQVMEMELKVDSGSMAKLLKFLTGGFNGGTDVDKPLELSLKRLAEQEWNQVSSCRIQSFPVCHWASCAVRRVCCCMLWMERLATGQTVSYQRHDTQSGILHIVLACASAVCLGATSRCAIKARLHKMVVMW